MNLPDFKTRADLALAVPDGGTMVELGVARGDFALALMRANRGAWYVGIDRYTDRGHDEREYLLARGRIGHAGGLLLRGTFSDGLVNFSDGELDLVYVDGYAHTGQDGGATLREWFPKVKPGGILAGHDYAPKWRPTIEAVDAFVLEHGLELRLIDEAPFPSWWIRKPF